MSNATDIQRRTLEIQMYGLDIGLVSWETADHDVAAVLTWDPALPLTVVRGVNPGKSGGGHSRNITASTYVQKAVLEAYTSGFGSLLLLNMVTYASKDSGALRTVDPADLVLPLPPEVEQMARAAVRFVEAFGGGAAHVPAQYRAVPACLAHLPRQAFHVNRDGTAKHLERMSYDEMSATEPYPGPW